MINRQTVIRFKEGDRRAFEDIYNKYAPKLLGFLQKRNAKDAEDIVHDTFIRLWDKRDSIMPEGNLFGYICCIGLNIMLNKRRHNMITKVHLLNVSIQANIEQKSYSPEEEYIAKELSQRIGLAIKTLTNRRRKIFNLRRQGFSYREIAQKLGIKEKTVETNIYRMNKTLRKCLDY